MSDLARRAAARHHDAAVEFLARALLAETDGTALRGMETLAATAINRLRRAQEPDGPVAWGTESGRVVAHADAFPAGIRAPRADELAAIEACRRIAARAAAGALPDPTRGSTRWHCANTLPGWADGHAPTLTLSRWVFYRITA